MPRPHGTLRRSQVITTWGPGALMDLPADAIILAGLDSWPATSELERVDEPRLTIKVMVATGVTRPKLYAPPIWDDHPGAESRGVNGWRFPGWYLVNETNNPEVRARSRRLVQAGTLSANRTFDGLKVVPIRFVRACPKGHIADVGWREFVHRNSGMDGEQCMRQLWLDEPGASGDLSDMSVRCDCGEQRSLADALNFNEVPLGVCQGDRPWLGRNYREGCDQPSRLLIRSASNAYFPRVMSVLSIPNERNKVQHAVLKAWDHLSLVETFAELQYELRKPPVQAILKDLPHDDIIAAIELERDGGQGDQRDVKAVEVEAFSHAPKGYGDDVPVDPNFHARRLPTREWKKSPVSDGIEAVIQLHRLREVSALVGFSRFEPVTIDIHGELDTDAIYAPLAEDPTWFPAIENRGEGIFLLFDREALAAWGERPETADRIQRMKAGYEAWIKKRTESNNKFKAPDYPGCEYVMLHTLSHLLIQSLALRCGYPASSLKERIYVEEDHGFGVLIYTATPDAEGTLGGLVSQARHIEQHLAEALRNGSLCSNDPICAQNRPDRGPESNMLYGAACHGCCLIAETSCEMGNRHLDRAMVVPTLDCADAAFFRGAR